MQKKDPIIKEIAVERIETLFGLAGDRTNAGDKRSKELAKRYIKIAKSISTHYKVKIPDRIRNSICKKCGNVLIPGLNCKVRLASSKRYVAYVCECGEEKHIFYK
ncbi:MAG: ribonuclease P [Candidatus Micrarchaeota archaeon]|nr:ribonuclease P [Candidatus Micrarchaeota archaeon]